MFCLPHFAEVGTGSSFNSNYCPIILSLVGFSIYSRSIFSGRVKRGPHAILIGHIYMTAFTETVNKIRMMRNIVVAGTQPDTHEITSALGDIISNLRTLFKDFA